MAKTTERTEAKPPFKVSRAQCGQCGKELRYVPFALNNIMCRDCYGLDRYRRTAPSTVVTTEKPLEVVMTDEEASTPAA